MGDWLVIIGAAVVLIAAAIMFGDLMELRGVHRDPEAVAAKLETGVVGNRWVRWFVQLAVLAGMSLITIGLTVGIS